MIDYLKLIYKIIDQNSTKDLDFSNLTSPEKVFIDNYLSNKIISNNDINFLNKFDHLDNLSIKEKEKFFRDNIDKLTLDIVNKYLNKIPTSIILILGFDLEKIFDILTNKISIINDCDIDIVISRLISPLKPVKELLSILKKYKFLQKKDLIHHLILYYKGLDKFYLQDYCFFELNCLGVDKCQKEIKSLPLNNPKNYKKFIDPNMEYKTCSPKTNYKIKIYLHLKSRKYSFHNHSDFQEYLEFIFKDASVHITHKLLPLYRKMMYDSFAKHIHNRYIRFPEFYDPQTTLKDKEKMLFKSREISFQKFNHVIALGLPHNILLKYLRNVMYNYVADDTSFNINYNLYFAIYHFDKHYFDFRKFFEFYKTILKIPTSRISSKDYKKIIAINETQIISFLDEHQIFEYQWKLLFENNMIFHNWHLHDPRPSKRTVNIYEKYFTPSKDNIVILSKKSKINKGDFTWKEFEYYTNKYGYNFNICGLLKLYYIKDIPYKYFLNHYDPKILKFVTSNDHWYMDPEEHFYTLKLLYDLYKYHNVAYMKTPSLFYKTPENILFYFLIKDSPVKHLIPNFISNNFVNLIMKTFLNVNRSEETLNKLIKLTNNPNSYLFGKRKELMDTIAQCQIMTPTFFKFYFNEFDKKLLENNPQFSTGIEYHWTPPKTENNFWGWASTQERKDKLKKMGIKFEERYGTNSDYIILSKSIIKNKVKNDKFTDNPFIPTDIGYKSFIYYSQEKREWDFYSDDNDIDRSVIIPSNSISNLTIYVPGLILFGSKCPSVGIQFRTSGTCHYFV